MKKNKNICEKNKRTNKNDTICFCIGLFTDNFDEFIRKEPFGWSELNLSDYSIEELEMDGIKFPTQGNVYTIEMTEDIPERGVQNFAKLMSEINYQYSLRLLYNRTLQTYYAITYASPEVVIALANCIMFE